MSFVTKDKQLLDAGHTIVSNQFILNYLSDAPADTIKVYLLGLALADTTATLDDMATKLGLTKQDVIDSYLYWEEMGLVMMLGNPPTQVVYLDATSSNSALKKIKASKYSKFSIELQQIINGRILGVNEYNEYYMFLEKTLFQPEALLAVASYCVDLKGNDIKHQYILAVAHAQLALGATTLQVVAENLKGSSKCDSDIALFNKALGSRSKIDYEIRDLYTKWSSKMNFTLDTLMHIARTSKGSNYRKIDRLITEYYSKGISTIDEINSYDSLKAELYDIARTVTTAIGVYYQSLDAIVDEYIVQWVNFGYDKDTLAKIAKYCFRSNVRTLAGVENVVSKLYKLGLVSSSSIDNYIFDVVTQDKAIKQLLEGCNIDRNVNNYDRALYKTWTNDWQLSHQLIVYASTLCSGANNAMKYLNKVLSSYKQSGITTVEQAQAQQLVTTTTTANKQESNHEYTDQELNALFSDLDSIEV